MKWILLAATGLTFAQSGLASDEADIVTTVSQYSVTVDAGMTPPQNDGSACKTGTFKLFKNSNVVADAYCKTTSLTDAEAADADADSLSLFAIENCNHALQVVDQDNCFVEDVVTFDVDGNFAVTGHNYGHRNSSATAFTVITKNIKRAVRGLLEVYCGSGGQTSWLFDQVNGDPRLCNSGYCATTFGTGNACADQCGSLVATNCGGGACDLTGVSCSTDCSTFSADETCNQDCADVKVASGCFTK